MTAVTMTPADLAPFATIEAAKAAEMIRDALALAAIVAPCITSADFAHPDAARAIIRGAILRWHEAGSGAVQTTSTQTGPFGQQQTLDTRQQRRGMFWPSELVDLEKLCRSSTSQAFSIDTASGASYALHADVCSLRWVGGTFCSCGAALAGVPLYE